jgi:hypothetical protein
MGYLKTIQNATYNLPMGLAEDLPRAKIQRWSLRIMGLGLMVSWRPYWNFLRWMPIGLIFQNFPPKCPWSHGIPKLAHMITR